MFSATAFVSKVYQFDLDLVRHVVSIRTDSLNSFFSFLAFFDSPPYYLLLIIFIYHFLPKRRGIHFLYLALFSALLNSFLKKFCEMPRPLHLDPFVGGLKMAKSYGFPSGAAHMSLLIFLFLKDELKSKGVTIFLLLYFLLISFSRIYLGLHFVVDILGGYCSAILIMQLYKFFRIRMLPYFFGPLPYISCFLIGGAILYFLGKDIPYSMGILLTYCLVSVLLSVIPRSLKVERGHLPDLCFKFGLSGLFYYLIVSFAGLYTGGLPKSILTSFLYPLTLTLGIFVTDFLYSKFTGSRMSEQTTSIVL